MTARDRSFYQRIDDLLTRRGLDRPVVIALAVLSLTLLALSELAEAVLAGGTRRIDETIVLALRSGQDVSQPLGPVWFQEMVRDFTALGSTGVLAVVTLGVVVYLLALNKGQTALFLLLSILGGVALSSLLKIGFSRPRPDLVPHSVVVFTNSFPSGHAMMSAIVYLTLGELLSRTQESRVIRVYLLSLAVFLTTIIGVSRIYLGVHWPSDVLAGWAVGACWALLSWLVMRWLQRRGRVEPPSDGAAKG